MQVKTNTTMQCALDITANARNGMLKWFKSEQALFASQQNFDVYIEKRPENRQGNQSFSFFFDNIQNENLGNLLNERVAVMDCVFNNDGFLATGFHVRGKREPVKTNRRFAANLKFVLNRRIAAPMPIELYTALRELPIAEERSEYVKKRIASWEGYLHIQEMNADVEDIKTSFTSPRFNEDFSKLHITCHELQGKDLRAIKGFSANITGLNGDIGNVIQVKPSQKSIEIELTPKFRNMARRHDLNIHSLRDVTFSNFAELSQVRRLRKGFKDLQDGLAANSNLEKILFEERPLVRITNRKKELEFHNRLNQFQREAVVGAMTANDLYVIQGPPGTGKTTVISEICYQNAKAGLRTLVASQANLAVDNALGRLLDDQDIRILRYGRTESIEEEGKKFIEENVAIHWKEQTIQSLENEIQQYHVMMKQLVERKLDYEEKLAESHENLKLIEAKILEKEQAEIAFEKLTRLAEQLKTNKDGAVQKEQSLKTAQQLAQTNHDQLVEKIEQVKVQMDLHTIYSEEKEANEAMEHEINKHQQMIDLHTKLEKQRSLETELKTLQLELETNEMKMQQLEQFLEESLFLLKLDDFLSSLSTFNIEIPSEINSKIMQLQQLIVKIKESLSKNTYDVWIALGQRLEKAIAMVENVLKEQGFLTQTVQRNFQLQNRSPEEVHAFLDRMGRFLVSPQTKQLLATRHYSAEKYDALEKLASAYMFLRQQKEYTRMQYAEIDQQKTMIAQSKQLFKDIKKEMIETVNEMCSEITMRIDTIKNKMDELPYEQTMLKDEIQTLSIQEMDETQSIEEMKEILNELKERSAAYKEKQQAFKTYETEFENYNEQLTEAKLEIEKNRELLIQIEQEIKRIEEKQSRNKEEQDAYAGVLKSEPEIEQTKMLQKISAYEVELEETNFKKERLPIKEKIQSQWLTLLQSATDYDLEEIRKLYIQHANVIGTTCVASARRDFIEDYPTFDVVIIDEVSKATPPELLLPMLKGKKIILVGDHHQLPPLIGQETLEEFMEEIDDAQEKKELAQLLNESLFERLFRTLPKQNKTMLAIQYRMHEKIMDTITPFYNEGNYALQCGLENSDAERDHLLESKYIERNNHLLWFDIPNEQPYFEDRVKGGTSRFNEAELSKIKSLLIDLDHATSEAKKQGRIDADVKKNIGVISFYGEQVKRIDRLIQHELELQHLHCRTGSVDKFQGMEMDVIILSFVRNHDLKNGDIGFAKDYRRLNVALSRARELLMIVGSAQMFTTRPRDPKTREMFGLLLEKVKEQEGFKQLAGVN